MIFFFFFFFFFFGISELMLPTLFRRSDKKSFHFCVVHFCVTCVAWQTHRDHVVHPHWRGRCCRHTFRFRSITFDGMYGFHSNFAELYIAIKYRSGSILVIIRQNLAELWPFFDLVFVVCFCSITFEGMHWFHSNFAELYIDVKYRSSLILVIIH